MTPQVLLGQLSLSFLAKKPKCGEDECGGNGIMVDNYELLDICRSSAPFPTFSTSKRFLAVSISHNFQKSKLRKSQQPAGEAPDSMQIAFNFV